MVKRAPRRTVGGTFSIWVIALMTVSSMLMTHVSKVYGFRASSSARFFSTLRTRTPPALSTSLLWESAAGNGSKVSSSPSTLNQGVVQRRLQIQQAKRQAREQTIQERANNNYKIKRLLHTQKQNSQEFSPPPLYQIKVWVSEELRQELKLSGREKRGRLFIETESDGTTSLKGLQQELYGFFSALRKNTYLLTASIPLISEDGTIESRSSFDGDDEDTTWKIESDDDVLKTFRKANEFFEQYNQEHTENPLTRPSIQISVSKDPNAPPPPPPPSYLIDLPDPSKSETITMLSFYAFPPGGIDDPYTVAFDLEKKWKPFQALGRVYVAQEGINAQMSVPSNVLDKFWECCASVPALGEHMENGINIDPKPLSREEFATAGVPVNGKPAPPFRNLHVRVRNQVVADGLDKSLDWQSAGYDMPPMEWHAKVKEARDLRRKLDAEGPDSKELLNDLPILLDCRNKYETDVGIFEGAEPLDTENFRETWDVLKDRLADTPKDAPIMTYCTGGIRCVKVGAYLTQELGFTNVSRLAGGIIAYDRTLTETSQEEEPMFKGTNFVFDGRLGRKITDDSLAECITCGSETSFVSNCRNDSCHKRMVQCKTCETAFHGTCSEACKNRIVNGAMSPRKPLLEKILSQKKQKKYANIDDYSLGHSSPTPNVYAEMELNTQAYLPSGSHMVSGAAQGRLLTQLTSMTREGRVLELGTFTGYATACFVEGARNVGQVTGASNGDAQSGPYVLSMERDDRAFNLASAHMKTIAEHGFGEAAAEAVCAFRNNVPVVEDDKVSVSVDGIVGCDIIQVTDALATVEAMAQGTGDISISPFDLVFVDADKTRLLEYVEACLSSDRVLKKGGIIVVDNVLWKGLVIEASSGEFSSVADSENDGKDELRKNRRARKLATQMHAFNSAIVEDDRVEVMLLPMRDGLSVIRKK
jgi:predicted sulfurtransferase/predicted O-methyltransferase YrrM